jgi:hypothetical protein
VTEHGEGPSTGERRTERVTERVVSRQCRGCGGAVIYAGTGRRGMYCSARCRQRAWALRTAERQLNTGADPRPAVVRDVIERETVVRIAPPTLTQTYLQAKDAADRAGAASVPATGRDWALLLARLTDQLVDDDHPVAREHWHHDRLHTALMTALAALDAAHPGGLARLRGRGRR